MSDLTLTCLRVGQWLYWAALFCTWIGFLLPLIREKSLSPLGALLGFIGTFMLFGGFDAVICSFVTWMTDGGALADGPASAAYIWHPLIALEIAPAMVIGVSGAVLCWLTEDTAFFIRPEGRAAWYMTRRKAEERAIAAALFQPFGNVVHTRSVVDKHGVVTELVTTNGTLVIDGEIGSADKGQVVYINSFGDVRIGTPQARRLRRRPHRGW
ncbi:hypothetical protein VI03_25445 [Burkholderia vietnamiensis]|uniref:hypothetical protein n=1 Tax=Burkholderia vietnamiensis TaxID=60552 RepID=UPI000622641E|nr:hypothetical protein [Burkholderia vietnamiensis]KKI36119.1 hypothetical protein VI03_25445 [Burkholderia vietnamiensis]MBR8189107.1 hypothetical protein [Burkholderia vietnamiensis]